MTLIADDEVKAVARLAGHAGQQSAVRNILAAFVVYREGERPCERCYEQLGKISTYDTDCPHCHGTGKVRERTLTTIGPEDDGKIRKAVADALYDEIDVGRAVREALIGTPCAIEPGTRCGSPAYCREYGCQL
jgi:hypothetical protein